MKTSWGVMSSAVADSYLLDRRQTEPYAPKLLAKRIFKTFGKSPSILDVGCGNGALIPFLVKQFPQLSYVGVDVSAPLIESARRRYPQHSFVHGDILTVAKSEQFDALQFDVAVLRHVLEMMEDPAAELWHIFELVDCCVIEFFDPPTERTNRQIIQMNDYGLGPVPIVRNELSLKTFLPMLVEVGVQLVERFATPGRYEVWILHKEKD